MCIFSVFHCFNKVVVVENEKVRKWTFKVEIQKKTSATLIQLWRVLSFDVLKPLIYCIYHLYAFVSVKINEKASVWWALSGVLGNLRGETEHSSGNRTLRWRILVGKPTHNVQKPGTLTKGNQNWILSHQDRHKTTSVISVTVSFVGLFTF